jgi:hypothetical protein
LDKFNCIGGIQNGANVIDRPNHAFVPDERDARSSDEESEFEMLRSFASWKVKVSLHFFCLKITKEKRTGLEKKKMDSLDLKRPKCPAAKVHEPSRTSR